jgi:O-antigen chain-terminating methyltransferase
MHKIKKAVGYALKTIKQVALLPRHVARLEAVQQQLTATQENQQKTASELTEIHDLLKSQASLIASVDTNLMSMKEQVKNASAPAPIKAVNNTVADNHELDHFYKLFEDKFRGDEESIKERVSEHIPLFTALSDSLQKKPIVDIGCGRGEFLSAARDHNLKAIGVDMNKSMVERANDLGFEAYEDDAISYISRQATGSLAGVTGFHIVEHIPFDSLVELFAECHRALALGGVVLFETPNPENIVVGACNFYMDPSHINPIPPHLLAFALESVGFDVEIRRIHPVKDVIEHEDPIVKDIMGMVYGPRDYAVVARKVEATSQPAS